MLKSLLLKHGYQWGCRLAPHVPQEPRSWLLLSMMNRQLREALDDGDFDFLQGRSLAVSVTDLGVSHCFSVRTGRFIATDGRVADATIAASAADLLAIADGREDPDTLFFQRRLSISGDTELGLTAKNSLDAFDKKLLAHWMRKGLHMAANALAEARAI